MFYIGSSGDSTYTYLLIATIVVMILGFVAQSKVQSTFKKFSSMKSSRGIAAWQIAQNLLNKGGSDVRLTRVGGSLTDHYNPKKKTVGLSESVYDSDSVSAIAVAAHEIGHVMQYKNGYAPIKIRNAILPIAQIGSTLAPIIVLIGVFMEAFGIAIIGVYLFGALLLFQLITLPVEFNASSRAIDMLVDGGYLADSEKVYAKKVLNAAAMTYVVSALATLVTFLRLLLVARGSRR